MLSQVTQFRILKTPISYITWSEVKIMRCIYFDGKNCFANPPIPAVAGIYEPPEDDKKEYCEVSNFLKCPRAIATQEHLKAMSKLLK
jgi:hypothetical protein